MNIRRQQFTNLINRYYEYKLAHGKDIQVNEASFQLAMTFIHNRFGGDYINLIALASEDKARLLAHKDHWQHACQFFDKALVEINGELIFNNENANAVALEISKEIDWRHPADLHGSVANLGIKEKFIKGILSDQEWLAEIDIRRFLLAAKLNGKVQVCPFIPSYMEAELAFAKPQNNDSNSPYHIHLVLNKMTDAKQQGAHWLSIKFTVNPVTNKISYTLDDSLSLTSSEKENYKTIIKQACKGYILDESQSKIQGNATQHNTYDCGYRALHTLVQNSEFRNESQLATDYANCESTSLALCHFIYNSQIDTIIVDEEYFKEKLNSNERQRFSTSIAKDNNYRVNSNHAWKNTFHRSREQTPYDEADRIVSKYSIYLNELTFPATSQFDLPFQAFYQFLRKLHDKIYTELPLQHLYLKPCSLSCLQGTRAYLSEVNSIHIKQIHLDLNKVQVDATYLDTLKLLIKDLSDKNLHELDIKSKNNPFTKDQVTELTDYILSQKISVKINLPTLLQNTVIQRRVDEAVQINSRIKRLTTAGIEKKTILQKQSMLQSKRKRPKIHAKGSNIDVELQQQVQLESAIENQQQAEFEEIDTSNLQLVRSLDELKNRLKNGEISLQPGADLLSDYDISKAWHAWFGNVATYNHNGKQFDVQQSDAPEQVNNIEIDCTVNPFIAHISLQACEVLLNNYSQFKYGLEAKTLPRGFSLIEHPIGSSNKVLHYDKSTLLFSTNSALAPILEVKQHQTIVDDGLLEEYRHAFENSASLNRILIEFEKLQGNERNGDSYQRSACMTVRRLLPQLLTYSDNELDTLFSICTENDVLQSERLSYAIENADTLQTLFPNGLNKKTEPAYQSITRTLGSEENARQLLSLKRKTTSEFKPIILTLLNENEALIHETVQWAKKLAWNNSNYDALLDAYHQYGTDGLEKLYALWNKHRNLFISMHNNLLKKLPSYADMIGSNQYDRAFKSIAEYTAPQMHWFNVLLTQHSDSVGTDSLPNLVESFNEFSKNIQQLKLNFYTPIAFSHVKNMPTALSRILSILKSCKPEDLNTQWQCISQLSLQSDGAMKAITDTLNTAEACKIIVPEMQATTLHHGYTQYKQGYALIKFAKYITENDELDIKILNRNFYRYLAHQQFRRPLDEYQTALGMLYKKSFHPYLHLTLTRVLAESTSGAENSLSLEFYSRESFLAYWKGIISNADKLKLPAVINAMIPKSFFEGKEEDKFKPNSASEYIANYLIDNSINKTKKMPSLHIIAMLIQLNCTLFEAAKSMVSFSTINPYELDASSLKTYHDDKNILQGLANKMELINATMNMADNVQTILKNLDESNCLEPVSRASGIMIKEEHTDKLYLPKFIAYCDIISAHFEKSKISNKNTDRSITASLIYITGIFKLFDSNFISSNQLTTYDNDRSNFIPEKNRNTFYRNISLSYRENSLYREKIPHLDGILSKYENSVNRTAFSENLTSAFNVLNYINEQNSALNSNSFISLINEISESHTSEETVSLVYKHFGDHLPEYSTIDSSKDILPTTVVDFIKNKLSTENQVHVTDILMKFLPIHDNEKLLYLAKCLFQFQASLPQADATSLFVNLKLCSGLYKANHPDSISRFTELLFTTIDNSYHNELNFFLEKSKEYNTSDHIIEISHVYLNHMLPEISRTSSSVISKTEMKSLAINLLLQSDIGLISNNQLIDIPDDQPINQFEVLFNSILDSDEKDPVIIANIIERLFILIPKSRQLESLDKLYHLSKVAIAAAKNEENAAIAWLEEQAESISKTVSTFIDNFLPDNKTEQSVIETSVKLMTEIDIDLLKDAQDEFRKWKALQKTFPAVINQLVNMTEDLANSYPDSNKEILAFCTIMFNHSVLDKASLENKYLEFSTIKHLLTNLNDNKLIYSLFHHFSKMHGDLNPSTLISILQLPSILNSNMQQSKILLNIISALLDNDFEFSISEFKILLSKCANNNKLVLQLGKIYQQAPYPPLDKLLNWIDKEAITEQYLAFDITPCEREFSDGDKGVNGFYIAEAINKARQLNGFEFYIDDLELLQKDISEVRSFPTSALLQQIKLFKQPDAACQDMARLTALAAELLYRAKGKESIGSGDQRQWGRSFEINTTQYLAIYSMMKSGKHTISEVATGEGKSRIMMILAACQYALGNTVDFVTSDMTLARRDYTEFQSYFSLLGAQTRLIYADSPAKLYAMNGINMSDDPNISLFRNKAHSEGNGHLVINTNRKNRAILHDEIDKALFDTYAQRFNYSSSPDESIRNMEWIFPVLVDFFDKRNADNEPVNHNVFYEDIDECNKRFLDYAASLKSLSPVQINRIKTISAEKLETWQVSAMTALSFEFDKDYTIIADTIVHTARGPVVASKAVILVDNQKNDHSVFSFGVHQCLHARLNRMQKHPHLIEDVRLKTHLGKCAQAFHLEDEKQIIYSSTNNDLFNDYSDGLLIGVTGTAGSNIERKEVSILHSRYQSEPVRYIEVPRHNGLNRHVLPIQLVANDEQLTDYLAEKIDQRTKNGQPSIVFSDNDSESDKLKQNLKPLVDNSTQLKRIHAKTDLKKEEKHIGKLAGSPGFATISTSKVGRGTDIGLKGEAKNRGLSATLAFLTGSRETRQNFGRASRFGAPGEIQMVLRKDALKVQLGKESLNDGFYTATEDYINHYQQVLDDKNQNNRLISFAVGDFRKKLTDNFYGEFYLAVMKHERSSLEPLWKVFFDDVDKIWTDTHIELADITDKHHADGKVINAHLLAFRAKVQNRWEELLESVANLQLKAISGKDPINLLLKTTPELQLSPDILVLCNTLNNQKNGAH